MKLQQFRQLLQLQKVIAVTEGYCSCRLLQLHVIAVTCYYSYWLWQLHVIIVTGYCSYIGVSEGYCSY